MSEPSIVKQVLEAWGATAKSLPTSKNEESDWLAELKGCRLLIEEKTKYDDPTLEVTRQAAFMAGEVYTMNTTLVNNNRLSGIVTKAVNQLNSSGSKLDHDLRIIWLNCVGAKAEAKYHQFIATLYGSTSVLEVDKSGLKQCYFFRNSDFFRYGSQIDGAIAGFLVGDTLTMKLCLNPYSPNWQKLRDSPYANQIQTGLIDPHAEEIAGKAYVVDTDIDRNDQAALFSYLQKKYKTGRLMNMDMNMVSVEVVIPKSV